MKSVTNIIIHRYKSLKNEYIKLFYLYEYICEFLEFGNCLLLIDIEIISQNEF